MSHSALLGVAVALLGVACSQSQVPAGKLANTRSAISAAEESGADKTPRSALHLKMAEDQLADARRLMKDKKNDLAKHSLRRAIADAELAEALAREASAMNTQRHMMEELEKEGVVR